MTNEVTTDVEESGATDNSTIEQANTTETLAETPETATPGTNGETASTDGGSTSGDQPAPAESAPNAESAPAPAATDNAPTEDKPAPAAASVPPAATDSGMDDQPSSSEVDFGAILEQFEQEQTVYHAGELVEGQVVGITDRGVLVDFGYKSEGFVPVEEFTGPDGNMNVAVGDNVSVVIRTIHSGDSAPQLSRNDALARIVWDEAERAFQSETPVVGRVVDKTKGGLRVDLNGIEAFLPGSQIDSRPIRGLDTYIGQDIEARIIKFSRRRNNIVLSRKVITDEVVNAEKAKTLENIDIGYVVEGTIKNLTEYGAFVDIGGIDGLLHVTDMSWGRLHHPGDQFKVGEHIQVKVLKLDREKEKVSLGYKQLLPDPWSTVVEVYPVDTKLMGTVSSVTDYGVFVELEPGVEGLVHVSEISWSRRAQSPKRIFHRGQQVEVQVLGVDTVDKRISLGMKQFQSNPWDTVDQRYPIGTKIHGRIRNLTDFGAFVELEEGIDGLVHVSDITWTKKIKHPKDVLKKDQEVDAIVTSIDKRNQRLSLSMKDLTPSAWESFVATHRPGDVVRGKVSRFTNFGIFVELGDGLEGLCHISELSDERVDRAENVAQLGQEMDFKILRIEHSDQKIGLSHKAVGKEDTPIVDTKMYSSEAKGGMASLGELANLRFGQPAEQPAAEIDPEERKRQKQEQKKQRAEEFAAREAAAANEAAQPSDETEPAASDETAETSTETSGADEAPQADSETSADSTSAETPAAQEEPAAETSNNEAPAAGTEETLAAQDETPSAETATAETHDAPADEPSAEAPADDTATSETTTGEAATSEDAAATDGETETGANDVAGEPAAAGNSETPATTSDESPAQSSEAPADGESEENSGDGAEKQTA